MTHSYPESWTGQRGRHWLLAALLALGTTSLHAQNLNYRTYGTATGVLTYTDVATAGTLIATADTDDANSAPQEIGFSFRYNGQDFTQFILNTNGYVKLGNVAPTPTLYYTTPQAATQGGAFSSTAATDINLLVPFGVDLVGAADAEYRVVTTGTAPNRVCTIQWKNVQDKARPTATGSTTIVAEQYTGFSFQVKLYETTNVIDFAYGSATAGTGTTALKVAAVGLKGSGSGFDQVLSVTKASTTSWAAATFQQGNYTGNAFNFNKTVLPNAPDPGRTYRFRPAAAQDANVAAIYTLGKLPAAGAGPQVIQGAIRNEGYTTLTNIPVTLTVAGANSFTSSQTVTSIAPGATATVSFDAFYPTILGANTVTVALTRADDTPANNTRTVAQEVTAGTYSHATPGAASTNSYGGALARAFVSRFQTTNTRTVQSVNVFLRDETSVGRTVYAVVVNATGAVVARSADYVVQTADLDQYKAFTFSNPAIIYGDVFFAGLAQTAYTSPYYPVGVQAEVPTRRQGAFLAYLDNTAPIDLSTSNVGKLMIEAVTAPVTCLPPTNLIATAITATTATLAFTPPTGTSSYEVVYGPTGFDPAATTALRTTATTSPVILTGLTATTAYQAYVRTTCASSGQSIFAGPVAFTTSCTSPEPVAAFPYTQNFDGITAPALPCGFTTVDANNDGYTWINSTAFARSPSNALTYNFNNQTPTTAADDWVFTPALTLAAAQQYLLSFYYRVGAANGVVIPERLEVKVGNAPTVAAMTTTIYTNNNLTATAFTQATASPIRVTTDGTYYIGMHVTSAANSFRLAIDDITLTAGPLAVNQALSRAIGAYPNPTTGLLTVDLRSSNARQAQATVVNALGQTVLTRTLNAKQLDQLNLAPLAAGIYTLKLDINGETAVKRISVQK